MRILKSLGAPLALLALLLPAIAEQGVESSTVRFAQVAALDGPAGALGSGMRDGILAAFAEANRAGGVHGRTIELESFDDGYEPDQSVAAVRSVFDGDAHRRAPANRGAVSPSSPPKSAAWHSAPPTRPTRSTS